MWSRFHTSKVSSRSGRLHSRLCLALGLLALAAVAMTPLSACDCGSVPGSAGAPEFVSPTVPSASAWQALSPQASAWVMVDLDRVRADGRFDGVLQGVLPSEAVTSGGQLAGALSSADRVLFAATDAFFSDRFHVLEGAWDGGALAAELESGDSVATERLNAEPLGEGALWSAPGLPWAVAWDGESLLGTGPPTALRMAFPPVPGRATPDWAEGAMVAASWTPPELVRGVLADRIARPELADPIRALAGARATINAGAGLDVHIALRFEDPSQVAPGRTALEALLAVLVVEFTEAPLSESLRGLTFESRESDGVLDVWWQIDRASLRSWLTFAETLVDDGDSDARDDLTPRP